MRERARQWINRSNREEAMARVLSRNDFAEGAVLHAHRAASAALIAVFAENGWAWTSERCEDLCHMLEAHDITPHRDIFAASQQLDAASGDEDLLAPRLAGAPLPPDRATASLDCVKRIRAFVVTVLGRG
jgi:HEPN domain-containing protein